MPNGNQRETPADPALAKAQALHEAGRPAEAAKAYRRLLKRRPRDPQLLHLLGLALHQSGHPRQGAHQLSRAAALAPQVPDIHRFLGLALRDAGDARGAETAFRTAVDLDSAAWEAWANLATLLRRQGRLDDAEEAFAKALETRPDSPAVNTNMGNLLRERGRFREAAGHYRAALRRKPDHAGALASLSSTQLRLGEPRNAEATARDAVAADPTLPEAHFTLATALQENARPADAEAAFDAALARAPDFTAARAGRGAARLAQGDMDGAVRDARAALAQDPDRDEAHAVMGQALYAKRAAGAPQAAAAEARAWLAAHPHHPMPRHMAASLTDAAPPERAEDAYVRLTFDQFAPTFDATLGHLGYRGPDLLADAVRRHGGNPAPGSLEIIDLGCGTGLVGAALRPFARRLTGVDLSPDMLALARDKGLYDRLDICDLEIWLKAAATAGMGADLVVAGDVLIYLGDLTPLVAAAAALLHPGGRLIVTAEQAEGAIEDGRTADTAAERWCLGPHGRYRHGAGYLRAVAEGAGLTVIALESAALRQEGDAAVRGWVMTAMSH